MTEQSLLAVRAHRCLPGFHLGVNVAGISGIIEGHTTMLAKLREQQCDSKPLFTVGFSVECQRNIETLESMLKAPLPESNCFIEENPVDTLARCAGIVALLGHLNDAEAGEECSTMRAGAHFGM